MATIKPIFDYNTVFEQSNQLLADARKLCDSLNPAQSTVFIALKKANAHVLNILCEKMDDSARPAVKAVLEKAQTKLALAEKINQFQREANVNKSIDPRVEKLMDKLTKMSGNSPDSAVDFEKLGKWRSKLDRIRAANQMTHEKLLEARNTVCTLDMEFLKKSPHFVRMGDSILSAKKHRQFYNTLQNPERPKRQSSVAAAIFYLDAILKNPDYRIKRMDLDLYILNGEEVMVQLIAQKQPEWRIPEQDVIQVLAQNFPFLTLAAVSSSEIFIGSCANQQKIQSELEALIKLKNANGLKSMGAFVGLGCQTLALIFHSTDRISLYNPCGDTQRQFSYEANFGSTKQVAEFLWNLRDEFNMLPPITLKPYCLPAAPAQPKNSPFPPVASRGISFPLRGPTTHGAVQPPSRSTPHPSFGMLPLPPPMPYSTGHGPAPISLNSTSSAMPGYFPQMPFSPGTPVQASLAYSPLIGPSTVAVRESDETSGDDSGVDTDDEPEVKNETLVEFFPGMTDIKASIQALSQRNDEGYFQSIHHLMQLKENRRTWADGSNCTTLDRVNFHLYHVQDKETPDKIDRNDHTWGMTALLTESLSTPDQKLRAVQRTLVEELLLSLEAWMQRDGRLDEDVQLLDELVELKLNPSDLPSGQTNAADALFGKFKQVYSKARGIDPSLVEPHNIGSKAFKRSYSYTGIEKTKIEALKELAKDFKAAWRI